MKTPINQMFTDLHLEVLERTRLSPSRLARATASGRTGPQQERREPAEQATTCDEAFASSGGDGPAFWTKGSTPFTQTQDDSGTRTITAAPSPRSLQRRSGEACVRRFGELDTARRREMTAPHYQPLARQDRHVARITSRVQMMTRRLCRPAGQKRCRVSGRIALPPPPSCGSALRPTKLPSEGARPKMGHATWLVFSCTRMHGKSWPAVRKVGKVNKLHGAEGQRTGARKARVTGT